jgi:hypothetical protein
MIVGGPNAGKSTSAVHLTQTIALGRDWFGHKTLSTPVLYCCAEAPDAIEAQEAAWLGHHGQDASDRMAYCEQEFDLDDVAQVEHFIKTVQDFEVMCGLDFGILVFDTLSDYLGRVEENSNTDMRKINRAIRRIATTLDCAIILVHHYGKDENRGPRGAQCLNAKLDVRLDCWSEGNLTLLEVGKMRRGKKGARFNARRHEVVVGVDSFGLPSTGCVMIEEGDAAQNPSVPAARTVGQSIIEVVMAAPGPIAWSDVRRSLQGLGFAKDDAGRVAAERARNQLSCGSSPMLQYDKRTKMVSLAAHLVACPTTPVVNDVDDQEKPSPANNHAGAVAA